MFVDILSSNVSNNSVKFVISLESKLYHHKKINCKQSCGWLFVRCKGNIITNVNFNKQESRILYKNVLFTVSYCESVIFFLNK